MDNHPVEIDTDKGEVERIGSGRSAVLVLAVSLALAFSTQSGPLLRPLLDFEPLRNIPYSRAALITMIDLVVMLSVLRLAGLSGTVMGHVSGVFAPIGRALLFGVLTLGPSIMACAALVPLAANVSAADVAWKVFGAPFFEEVVFRGLAVGVLVRLCGWPIVAACIWPAAFFGVAHAWQGSDLPDLVGIVTITAAGGLLFGWLYIRWGFNLWPAIFLHAGLNSLWLLYDLGDNALGGWFGNGLRFAVVTLAIVVTVVMTPQGARKGPPVIWAWLRRGTAIVVAVVVAIPLGIMVSATIAGRAEQSEVEYLRRNAAALDLREADARLRLAPGDYEKRLFLLGEAHGVAVGQTLDIAMLRHLNTRAGVRFYVAEVDPAQAEWFNKYLDSGDTRFLNRVFAFWVRERYQWGNRNFFDKVVAIRTLNQTLPPGRRIRFLGMDRLQDAALMQVHLSELLQRIPTSSWSGADRLRVVLNDPKAPLDVTRDGPLALAGADLAATLPEAAPTGVAADDWRSLRAAVLMLADRRTKGLREEMITAAFERLLNDPEFSGEKFYGLWGVFHVIKALVNGERPFALNLETGSLARQIVSVSIFNLDSRMMMPGDAMPFLQPDSSGYATMPYSMDSALFSTLEGIESVKAAASGDATIFNLSAAGSPYVRSSRLARLHGIFALLQPFEIDAAHAPPDGAMNYIILAEGSGPTRPF